MTDDLNPFARIIISHHAIKRIHERLGRGYHAADARAEIRVAIMAGRVTQVRPNWAHGDGVSDTGCEDDKAQYVWNKDGNHCWVIVPNRATRETIVKTVLLSIADMNAAAEQMRRGR